MSTRQSRFSILRLARTHQGAHAQGTAPSAAEVLEPRLLLANNVQITLSSANAISSFAGVGFALNPVASITGTVNGVVDNKPGDYQVQIDWGDGGGRDSNVTLVSVGNQILVKG